MASAPPSPPQLTAENLNELQTARQRLKGIRRAVSAGRFEGYSIAICGGLTFLAGIGSLTSMAGGALLLGVGIVEVFMVGQLRKLDVAAPPGSSPQISSSSRLLSSFTPAGASTPPARALAPTPPA